MQRHKPQPASAPARRRPSAAAPGAGHWTRLLVVVVLLLSGLVGVGFRVFQLQSGEPVVPEKVVVTAADPALRGQILDRDGWILAASKQVYDIGIDPAWMLERLSESERKALLEPLADALGLSRAEVVALTTGEETSGSRWVPLKKGIDGPLLEQVEPLCNRRKGVVATPRFMRVYPKESLAAQVLGFVLQDSGEGAEGLELRLNGQLRGEDGEVEKWMDASVVQRKEIPFFRKVVRPRVDGNHVVTTLDSQIQYYVEQALERAYIEHHPRGISAIVLRPETGEILAIANRPSFNPNLYGRSTADERRNRALTDIFEPGSTFKPFCLAAALNEGAVSLNDMIFCENGCWNIPGLEPLHDDHPYGFLSAGNVVVKSSNIGIAKIAMRLKAPRYHHYLRRFGFGLAPEILLPAAESGILHPLSEWNPLSMTRVPMGHEVCVSALQLASAMSVIANGGRLMRPYVVREVRRPSGEVAERWSPKVIDQVLRPEVAEQLRAVLVKVVEEGTGKRARVPGYAAGGKTGTAQVAIDGRYVTGLYVSSFVGFAPADAPAVCVLVMVDRPQEGAYYGGTVAGPVFAQIVEFALNYLNVAPSREREELAKASPGR